MRFKTHLSINLSRMSDNFNNLKQLAPHNEVLFMIKADAYGHGMVPVVNFCLDNLGIKEFGCASIGEAIHLRNELESSQFDIYVFSDLVLSETICKKAYSSKRILPVISDLRDLEIFLNDSEFKYVPLCLKFDTGMNRLGFEVTQLDEVMRMLKSKGRTSIEHLMSHFSSSYVGKNINSKSGKQYNLFKEVKASFQSSGFEVNKTSMANSGAIEQDIALDETHIRPGLIMYGPSSLLEFNPEWKGKNVSEFRTHIIKLKHIKKGDHVGYGDHVSKSGGTLVTLPIGYGDGIPSAYRNLTISHMGLKGKLIGRVNMDMSSFLFSDEAMDKFEVDQGVHIWDESVASFVQTCREIRTIPYELFCLVSSRVPRIYSLK